MAYWIDAMPAVANTDRAHIFAERSSTLHRARRHSSKQVWMPPSQDHIVVLQVAGAYDQYINSAQSEILIALKFSPISALLSNFIFTRFFHLACDVAASRLPEATALHTLSDRFY